MNTEDSRLIAECLTGNQSAFGGLIRRYQDRLYNVVLRLVGGNPDDALDIVQETFLSAYQNLESFKGNAEFFTWLYRIAFNTAVSWQRKRRVVYSLEPLSNGELIAEPFDRSELNQPGDALERAEEEERLYQALNRLSPEYRIVLILKDIEDQKYEEIAQTLQIPVGTVRSRLHRARLELRALLDADK